MFAIVLAGGKVEWLQPLASNRPNAMVPLCGKPILEFQVEWLRQSGVTDIIVACCYRHEAIQRWRPWCDSTSAPVPWRRCC